MFSHLRIDELEQRKATLKQRIVALDAAHAGERFDDADKAEWHTLNDELERLEPEILSKRARTRRVEALSRDARHLEREPEVVSGQRIGYETTHVEALRAVDKLAQDGELPESALLRLDSVVRGDGVGDDAAYVAAASSPEYRAAFGKWLRYGPDSYQLNLSDREREAVLQMQEAQSRTASLTSTGGGFAVPVWSDPTVIPTSDGVINPIRQISRVETITGSNEWRGVSSAGVTASYSAEATEVGDNAPTLAQPTANVEKAQAFIPFTVEIGSDWSGFEAEMARMFRDARDTLEAEKFVTGLGHSSNQPEGVLVGATAVVTTAGTATIAVADIYSLKEALPARFRLAAKFVGADTTLDKIRRLTGPGHTTEMPVWSDDGPSILRRPAIECSTYPTTLSSGASVLTYGDWTQNLVLDRVGMSVELVPHLLHTSNNRPYGMRGLYCWWRSSSKVLTPAAFRTLKLL